MTWISVKDKLPTKDYKVVICLINGNEILCEVHEATFSLTTNRLSFYWPTREWIKDKYYGQVTHWMPLPEPPTGFL